MPRASSGCAAASNAPTRIIAVSGATQRDVVNLVPDAADRVRLIYNAPDPQFLQRRCLRTHARPDAEAAARERHRILERYQIRYPFLLYAGSIRPQKNIPRLIEAFAVVRSTRERIAATRTCGSSSSETKSRAIPTCAAP